MQYTGVIDCNNFFVSCERLFRPDLLGRPVMVLSSNDGCVVARSQEIKDMGIPMGVPYFEIKDIAEKASAVSFSSHFSLYRDISARVFTVVKSVLQQVEQYSIDEAFFSYEAADIASAEVAMRRLKTTVERLVGIPVSIGLASTKTQAKYASREAKKTGGIAVLSSEDWQSRTPTIELKDIWGVGGKLARRYREAGLHTVADCMMAPKPRLETLFGIAGLRLQAECLGQVMYPVATGLSVQKSTISSRSFKTSTTSLAVLKDAVAYHVRHAARNIRRFGLCAGMLSVTILPSRHGDFSLRGGTKGAVFTEPINDTARLVAEAMRLTEQLYEAGVPYKKAGISLGRFVPAGVVQPSLFLGETSPQSTQILNQTVDFLNTQIGREMVQIGRQAKMNTWSARQENLSPAYTTAWSELAIVRA